jgi:hypothetical protein
VAGIQRKIAAPSPQIVGGHVYLFESWSDGGAATHTISTPATDTAYTARFRELLPLPVVRIEVTAAGQPPVSRRTVLTR